MPDWTLSVAGAAPATLAALKIQGGSIEYLSRARDSATLRAHGSVDWAYGTLVGIYWQGERVFYGRVQANERVREGGAGADRSITVYGVWYWLERCPYRQPWTMLSGDELGQSPSSRVILNSAGISSHLSADGQLHAIVDYAASRGCPVAFGSSAVGITLPFDEQRDITCAQAIDRTLRLTPSVCSWIDYSAATPLIHFGQGDAYAAARVERDALCWRDDLVVPGLRIEIERINSSNGTQYRTLETLAAGDQDSIDTAFVSLALAGHEYSGTTRTLDVVTEAVGDHTAAAWWVEKHPRLSGLAAADVTVISATRNAYPPEDFPRISSSPLPDLTEAGCRAVLETFELVADITQRGEGGDVVSVEYGVELRMQFITTNAVTRTYRWKDGVSSVSAETTPEGLADDLLAHWSVLYAVGSFSAPLADGLPRPGQTVEDTPLQSVMVDIESKTLSASFGPPSQLSAQDFCSLMQGFRSTRRSFRAASKYTGEPAGDDEQDMTSIAPVSASDWSPGEPARQVIADGGAQVDIAPGEDLDSGEVAKFREITIPGEEGESAKTYKILSTEASDPDGDSPEDSPCDNHPEGGDGVDSAGGGGGHVGGTEGDGGVPGDGSDGDGGGIDLPAPVEAEEDGANGDGAARGCPTQTT